MADEPALEPGRWEIGSPVLHLREQATAIASSRVIDAFPSHLWEPLGLKVSRAPGDGHWTVRSSDKVGVTRLELDGASVHLRITPKFDGIDLFYLADWAYGTSSTARDSIVGRAELDATRSDPAACLLAWYLAEAITFATRWVRRGYVVREDELIGRVRGRIDVARYASRSLSAARPHVVPCRYTEPSQNTRPNQYLRAGVRQAAALARLVPNPRARTFLLETARRCLALLGGVDDVEMTPRQGARLSVAGPLRHYRPIIGFTTALLEGTYLSTDVGGHAQEAILWPLNTLYEQALRNVLDGWTGGSLERTSMRATVTARDGRGLGSSVVKPDFVLRTGGGGWLALDAKYKDVRPVDVVAPTEDVVDVQPTKSQRIRVRRADVYQAVAYSQHNAIQPAAVGLVYPVVLGVDDEYPEPVVVTGFQPQVHVLFWDVGPRADRHVQLLYAAIDSIASDTAGDAVA